VSAKEPLRPVYWIHGEDRAKVDTAVRRLIIRVEGEGGMPPERFEAGETPAAEVRTACEAMSFGGTRLVLVRRADEWKAADLEPLIDYLADPVPSTCLALVATAPPTPRMLAAVEGAGQVLAWGPPPARRGNERARATWFRDFLQAEVRRNGSTISTASADDVLRRAGRAQSDTGHLANEAAKLAVAAGDGPVTKDLVEALVVVDPEAKAYLLGDLIVSGDARGAQAMLADLAGGSETTAPIVIQRLLARHFRGIAAAQGPEAGQADVERITGLAGYPAQKAVEHARQVAPGAGEWCVARLADLELDLRVSALTDLGASRADGERLVLELGVRDLIGACGGR
jgi:DNA polymerase III subunit delta